MDRAEKEALVSSMREWLGAASLVIVTQQSGMTVAESSELRREVRKAGANHRVTKNRLVKLAVEGTKFEALAPLFTGPTSITFSQDPVAAAKVCVEYARKNSKLTVVGGALEQSLLDPDGVKALATLPSLDELRGKLVGLLQAPATKVATLLQTPGGQLARVLAAYGAKDEAA